MKFGTFGGDFEYTCVTCHLLVSTNLQSPVVELYKLSTPYHVPRVREAHCHPCLGRPLHVNVQELARHIVGVDPNEEVALGDVTPWGRAKGQTIVLGIPRLQVKIPR